MQRSKRQVNSVSVVLNALLSHAEFGTHYLVSYLMMACEMCESELLAVISAEQENRRIILVRTILEYAGVEMKDYGKAVMRRPGLGNRSEKAQFWVHFLHWLREQRDFSHESLMRAITQPGRGANTKVAKIVIDHAMKQIDEDAEGPDKSSLRRTRRDEIIQALIVGITFPWPQVINEICDNLGARREAIEEHVRRCSELSKDEFKLATQGVSPNTPFVLKNLLAFFLVYPAHIEAAMGLTSSTQTN